LKIEDRRLKIEEGPAPYRADEGGSDTGTGDYVVLLDGHRVSYRNAIVAA